MNPKRNRVLVEICGREFALIAEESEAYMKALAAEVNQMINESIYKSLRTSKSDAALLICLDLCDKNKKLNEVNDNMRMQIATYVDEIDKLKKQLSMNAPQYAAKSIHHDTEPEDDLLEQDDTEHDSEYIEEAAEEHEDDNADKKSEEKADIDEDKVEVEHEPEPKSNPFSEDKNVKSESVNSGNGNTRRDEKTTSIDSLKERYRRLQKSMSRS